MNPKKDPRIHIFFRYCKKCGRKFRPISKSQKACIKCQKGKRNSHSTKL